MNRLLKVSFEKSGYTYEFLTGIHKAKYPEKYLFPDEDKILVGLKKLHDTHEHIVIMPDFDMDGISAGCVLYAGLSLMGFYVDLYAPATDRGYGIDFADIDNVVKRWPDVRAILTCDVGVADRNAAAYAQSKEIYFYVTDHHVEKAGKRTADAIMDPSRFDLKMPFIGVCGAWVAWHLVMSYAKLACDADTQELIRRLVLFVGLGSCGDMMPMLYDTRLAVRDSVVEFNKLLDADSAEQYFCNFVKLLPDAYFAPFDNMRELHYHMLRRRCVREGDVTEETYGFSYCPVFNSFKRMGADISLLYEMLYKRYSYGDEHRLALFEKFLDLNAERKILAANLYGQLYGDPRQALAPYVYLIEARPGILGLLANKIMEQTGRPCLVLHPDGVKKYSGSGRIPSWMDPGNMLRIQGVVFDGHKHSFGVAVDEDVLMTLWKSMDRQFVLESHKNTKPAGPDIRPVIVMNGRMAYGTNYDFSVCSLDDYDVCMEYANVINKYRPFGDGFREPEFVLKFTRRDVRGLKRMGTDGVHLRISLDYNITCVWFGGAGFADVFDKCCDDNTVFGVSGVFSINRYNNAESLQFMVSGGVLNC